MHNSTAILAIALIALINRARKNYRKRLGLVRPTRRVISARRHSDTYARIAVENLWWESHLTTANYFTSNSNNNVWQLTPVLIYMYEL